MLILGLVPFGAEFFIRLVRMYNSHYFKKEAKSYLQTLQCQTSLLLQLRVIVSQNPCVENQSLQKSIH